MTRKDYILLSVHLRGERPLASWDPNKISQWRADVKAIADALHCDNSRFDHARFRHACGNTWDDKNARWND